MEDKEISNQLPQSEELPVLPLSMIEQVDKYLSNPLFQIAAKSHVGDIQRFIKDNSGEFEPSVYDYISLKYPNIYAIIKPPEEDKEEPKSEDKDEEEEPVIKPVPQAAITYEILELHKELYTPSEIADFLSEKYDINLYPMNVGRIIKRAQAAQAPKPEIKQATSAQAHTPITKPIDSDTHLVMSTAVNIINFWTNIKFYVYMSLAGLAGALIERAIILR